MKRALVLTLLLLMLVTGTVSADGPPLYGSNTTELSTPVIPQDFAAVYEAVEQGVVLITVHNKRGDAFASGSGWCWADDIIITNWHVVRRAASIQIWHESIGPVDPYGLYTDEELEALPYSYGMGPIIRKPKTMAAQVIGLDKEQDIAVLTMPRFRVFHSPSG